MVSPAQGNETKGPFSFTKENGPFDSLPCAAQGIMCSAIALYFINTE